MGGMLFGAGVILLCWGIGYAMVRFALWLFDHRLMAGLNEAFKRGDEERIRAILRYWHASPESVPGDDPGAELVRLICKIAQVQRRLKDISAEMDQLHQGELFKLKQAVEEAQANGRDLLKDLGEQLDREIARARDELKRATNQGMPSASAPPSGTDKTQR
jgi:hypothetical protein